MLKINDELKKLIPALTEDEYTILEQSIIDEGIRDPIVVWNGYIVDGHNRYAIALKYGLEYATVEREFPTIQDAKIWMIDNQKGRRNLTDGWKYELAQVKKAILLEKGREKLSEAGTMGRAVQLGGLSITDKGPEHNTQKTIADDLGWSTGKTAQADYVWNHGGDEIKEKVKSGDLSINQAYIQTKDGKPHVANNSGENEWYTPIEYIAAAKRVMLGIDTDPASSDIANRTVKAEKYFTVDDDGLSQVWSGRVWMNPPYSQPLIAQFCEAVTAKYQSGEITSAIVLVNNATETIFFQRMLEAAAAVCFVKGRIKFLNESGKPVNTPLQGQCFLYFGSNISAFRREYSVFGKILTA